MDIRIYARTFFENKIGTLEEKRLLNECRVISINDVFIHPEKPPFSKRLLHHPNLLVLFFDDVETEKDGAFSAKHAKEVVEFIKQDMNRPLLIHCTAGISRSGAVGLAAAEHYGCANDFLRDNPDIMPNSLVLKKMRQEFNSAQRRDSPAPQ